MLYYNSEVILMKALCEIIRFSVDDIVTASPCTVDDTCPTNMGGVCGMDD